MVATLRKTIRNEPYKNLLINGDMGIWQRAVSAVASSASAYRGPDRFQIRASGTSASSLLRHMKRRILTRALVGIS